MQGRQMNNDNSPDNTGNQDSNRSALAVSIIALLTIALLLLPPLPPRLRLAAAALAALALLRILGVFPHIRAAWRRVLNQLPSDDQRAARWKRAFLLIAIFAVALLLLPPLPPPFRVAAIALALVVALAFPGIFAELRSRRGVLNRIEYQIVDRLSDLRKITLIPPIQRRQMAPLGLHALDPSSSRACDDWRRTVGGSTGSLCCRYRPWRLRTGPR
jgi:hypothetical protein